MPSASSRAASHAGSWYESDRRKLERQIAAWLAAAPPRDPSAPAPRALIAPHAGHRYCGHVAAAAYAAVDPEGIERVFILGPSHHVFGRRCWLSPATAYETPFGPLPVDAAVYGELAATGAFDVLSPAEDEAEHSLELHLPFIAAVMGRRKFSIVPIVVGALSAAAEAEYGALLAPYLDDPSCLFVFSSDFCHWGRRFGYTYYDKAKGAVWQCVRWLDDLGIKAIETGDAATYAEYQAAYKNTICGRHPIAILLHALPNVAGGRLRVSFKAYDQSSRCEAPSDSSVSYAAAVVAAPAADAPGGDDGSA